MKKRLYLVDAVFIVVLLLVVGCDFVTKGWASTHGLYYVVGILSVACLAVADRFSAGIGSVLLVVALGSLIMLPVFELAGGGSLIENIAFFVLIISSMACSLKMIISVDRIQGVCTLVLVLWGLAIGISNLLSSSSYTGFWTAEIV